MIKHLLAFVLLAPALMLGSAQATKLTTTFAGGNGNEGNMFDIANVGPSSIQLTGMFEGHFDTGESGTAQIWYRMGSFVGFETNRSGWTLLGTNSYVSAGEGNPTPLNVGAALGLNPGDIFGILFMTSSQQQDVNYTNGTSPTAFSDGFLSITTGVGIDFDNSGLMAGEPPINQFSFNANRIWNGSIDYTTAAAPVPEPSTLLLLGGGLVGLAWYRRKRN